MVKKKSYTKKYEEVQGSARRQHYVSQTRITKQKDFFAHFLQLPSVNLIDSVRVSNYGLVCIEIKPDIG